MGKEADSGSGDDPVLVGAAPEFEACGPKDEFSFGRICDRLEALLEKATGFTKLFTGTMLLSEMHGCITPFSVSVD